jgi:ADP-ribose pyrophosphatase
LRIEPRRGLEIIARASKKGLDFMRKHGPWTIRESQLVYRDPWITLQVDQVLRPDGKPGTYCTVELKPGVCVVALDEDDYVYLTQEFHYAVGRVTIEGVSGGIEEAEGALQTAIRELNEELGISANNFLQLGSVDPFTAAIRSPTALFVATELSFGQATCEGTEIIDMVKMPLQEAIEMVESSIITHSPTCVLLYKIAKWRKVFS